MGLLSPIDKSHEIWDHEWDMRTHIILPDDLVEAMDGLVGKRRRSAFVAEAIRERVRREQLRRALKESAGILKEADYPEWATPAKVARWVRKIRREGERAAHRRRAKLSA